MAEQINKFYEPNNNPAHPDPAQPTLDTYPLQLIRAGGGQSIFTSIRMVANPNPTPNVDDGVIYDKDGNPISGGGGGTDINAFHKTGADNFGATATVANAQGDLKVGNVNHTTQIDGDQILVKSDAGPVDIESATAFNVRCNNVYPILVNPTEIQIDTPTLTLVGIQTATAPNVLYIDNQNSVTIGLAPSGGTGNWKVDGSNVDATAQLRNDNQPMIVGSTLQSTSLYATDLYLQPQNSTTITSPSIQMSAANGQVFKADNTGTEVEGLEITLNVTGLTNQLKIAGLATTTGPNLLYYDPNTQQVTTNVTPTPQQVVRSTTTMQYDKVAVTTTPAAGEFSRDGSTLYFHKTDKSGRDCSNNFVYLDSLINGRIPSVFLFLDNSSSELRIQFFPVNLVGDVYNFEADAFVFTDGVTYTFDQIVIRPDKIILQDGNETQQVKVGSNHPSGNFTIKTAGVDNYLFTDQVLGTNIVNYETFVVADNHIPNKKYVDDLANNNILDGGNTTGATVTIGTNDNNTLALEVNNANRLTLNSNGSSVYKNTSVVQLQSDSNFIFQNTSGLANALVVHPDNSNVQIPASNVTMANIPDAQTSKMLYWDSITGAVTRGDPPGLGNAVLNGGNPVTSLIIGANNVPINGGVWERNVHNFTFGDPSTNNQRSIFSTTVYRDVQAGLLLAGLEISDNTGTFGGEIAANEFNAILYSNLRHNKFKQGVSYQWNAGYADAANIGARGGDLSFNTGGNLLNWINNNTSGSVIFGASPDRVYKFDSIRKVFSVDCSNTPSQDYHLGVTQNDDFPNKRYCDLTYLTASGTATVSNKFLVDSTTRFQDDSDPTKNARFEVSSVAPNTTRVLTIPNRDGSVLVNTTVGNIPLNIALAPTIGDRLEYDGTNWVNSPSPLFSSIVFVNYATPTQIATTTLNQYVIVAPTTTLNSIINGSFDMPSNGRIRFTGSGTYNCVIIIELTGNFTTNARASAIRVYRDGVSQANSEIRDAYDNAGLYQTSQIRFLSTCTTNTYFECFMANTNNNSPFNCVKLRIELQLLNRTA